MDTNNIKNIKLKKNKFDDLITDCNFFKLQSAERALIYTMYWANSEKANKERYEFTNIIDMAKTIKNFIEG